MLRRREAVPIKTLANFLLAVKMCGNGLLGRDSPGVRWEGDNMSLDMEAPPRVPGGRPEWTAERPNAAEMARSART